MASNPTPGTARFRHRAEEVEAVQWTGSNADQLRAFAGQHFDTIDPEDRIEDGDQDAEVLIEASYWTGISPGYWVLKYEDHLDVERDENFRAAWEPAAPSVSAVDQTIRDRIAEAIHRDLLAHRVRRDQGLLGIVPRLTDAVLAVLPPPADRAALERVRTVLETEHVVGRTALEYRGLIASTLMADAAKPAQPQPSPCSVPNPCEDGELCARHEEEKAHAEGEHEYCGVTCEIQMPSAPMYNSIITYGIPGTRGMLDELLRRAAAGLLPTSEERQPAPDVVAFRNPDQPTALWCREHGLLWWELTPLTPEDLPDGGVCGHCGVDVLIRPEADRG